MAFSRTGSTDCMIPSLLSISLICGCMPSMAFLSGDLNEWLSIIESLEDSGSEGFLDVLDGSGLGNGGVSISSGLGHLSGREVGSEVGKELILGHEVVLVGSNGGDKSGGEFHL